MKNTSSQDYVYVNLYSRNSENIDDGNDPNLSFITSRNSPLILRPKNWDFSIISFQMDTGNNIPMWIPSIMKGQSDPDKTIYHMSMYYQMKYENDAVDTVYRSHKTRQVIFETMYPTELKTSPLNGQNINTKYYHVNTFQHICKIFNNNFKILNQAVIQDLQTQVASNNPSANPAVNIVPEFPKHPYMRYDKNSERFIFYFDKKGFHDSSADSDPSNDNNPLNNFNNGFSFIGKLYFDSNMWGLFPNLNAICEGNDLNNIEKNIKFTYRIIPFDDLGINTYTNNGTNYYTLEQDFSSVSSIWCPISGIVFTSNLIPVVAENDEDPIVFENGNKKSTSSIASYQQVLTDFEVPLASCSDYRKQITYSPSNYRMISLKNTSDPITNIDIKVFLRYKLNNKLFILELYNQSSIQMKLMFRKKNILMV